MGFSERNSKHRKKKVLVVAHDAGGAEVIAAYVRTHRSRANYRIYAAGPAARVFSRNRLPHTHAPSNASGMRNVMKKNGEVTLALLGTGWMTNIESNALKEAKRAGIKSTVYLDSWMNFREVFGYPDKGWQKNLPDEFWAGDKAALRRAKRYFPRSRIRLVLNEYFADIIRRYRRLKHSATDILFMSAHGSISEKLLEDFLAAASHRGLSGAIRVRLHPADERKRYERIARRHMRVRTVFSREKDIARDLVKARVVVGPETVALIPAHMLGIKTIRIVPKGEKAFLPFKAIRLASSARAALRALEQLP